MKTCKTERVVTFDIDGTLVLNESEGEALLIDDPYEKRIVMRYPHRPHIKLLKNYAARGFFIIVWSKNGYQWAEAVLKALGLIHKVNLIMTKPCVYIDDEPPANWMGEHVFIPADHSFGRD